MNLLKLCYGLVLIFIISKGLETKRVLGIFPHFGYSHFKVFYPLLRNLAERGHNVTVITYIKAPTTLATGNYEELLLEGKETVNLVPLDEATERTWMGLFNEYLLLHNEGQNSCHLLYKSGYIEEVLKRHKQLPYDLVITEYFNSDCQLAVPYVMQTPIVALSSCLLMPWYYERILLPDTPSYIQSEFIGFRIPLKWYERLTNFLQAKLLSVLYRYYTNYLDNNLISDYLNIEVDVADIARRQTRLMFGNQHYSLMGMRPLTQQFVEIGGIHINENEARQDLPNEIEKFLENTQSDVVFISWGSMIKASTLDKARLQAILGALKELDIKIIWKWETDDVPIKSEKFLFIKWAPQLSLLCHPKVTLFWGHGGLLSTTEAIYCGKPMVLTPIYGDQFTNAFAVENRNIGRIIDFKKIVQTNIKDTLSEMLHANSSYTSRALEVSRIFNDRESKPLDKATWWIEHLLDHRLNSEVLYSYAVDLNWFVFYSLDVICILVGVLLLIVFVIKHMSKRLLYKPTTAVCEKLKSN